MPDLDDVREEEVAVRGGQHVGLVVEDRHEVVIVLHARPTHAQLGQHAGAVAREHLPDTIAWVKRVSGGAGQEDNAPPQRIIIGHDLGHHEL